MDKAELLAEFKAQLDLFDKYQTYIDKARNYADQFNPAVVEKVISDNTEKIREVADVLDPLVADVRGVLEDLEAGKDQVLKGVKTARMRLEELELRKMIGELEDEDFDEATSGLRSEIESADTRVGDIDSEIDDFRETLDSWVSQRPDLDEEDSASIPVAEDDLLGDLEDEGGVELEDDEEEDDLLGEEAFADDGPADDGVHIKQVSVEDDVSAVFDDEEDVLVAGGEEEAGISFSDGDLDDLGDLGAEELAAPAEEAGEAQAVLVLQEGTSEEHIYSLASDVISLGRGRDNNIQVKNDSKVSRYHCKMYRRGGNFFIEDNKSANGTLVDGELITEKRLIGGEEIIIGETLFRFRIDRLDHRRLPSTDPVPLKAAGSAAFGASEGAGGGAVAPGHTLAMEWRAPGAPVGL